MGRCLGSPYGAPVALLTVGMIGWIGEPLDYMKLLIAPVAIGIAVDDTIHMMTRFHHEFNRLGNYHQALRESLRDVGRAITMTSKSLTIRRRICWGIERLWVTRGLPGPFSDRSAPCPAPADLSRAGGRVTNR